MMKKQFIWFVVVLFLVMGGSMIAGVLTNWEKLTFGKAAFLSVTGITCCIISALIKRKYKGYLA